MISLADRTEKNKKTKMPSDKTRALRILIKHEGSRLKASWKNLESWVILNTTGEAVVSQPKALREDIASGKAKSEDVAAHHSDCSSAKRGGDLGRRTSFRFSLNRYRGVYSTISTVSSTYYYRSPDLLP
ncbi:peptidylprolyl isomerase [Sarracenia purpurea var. burkii]